MVKLMLCLEQFKFEKRIDGREKVVACVLTVWVGERASPVLDLMDL